MGKRSKNNKRKLPQAYKALRQIAEIAKVYYNMSTFVAIAKIAKEALPKSKR